MSPQTTSPRGLLIATIVILALLFVSSMVMTSWWNRRAPGVVRNERFAKADGVRFGRTATAGRCVDQVLTRFARTPPGPGTVSTERQFLESCLAAATPSPETCAPIGDAAPPGDEWLTHLCAARQLAQDTCPKLLRPLATYCTTGKSGAAPHG
jgi:hypothetical protein